MGKVEEIDGREIDFSVYADKEPTSLQERFADWIIDKCELSFGTKKEEAAFRNGVRVSVALRIPFQSSDENRQATAEEREARAAERAKAKQDAANKRAEREKAKGAEQSDAEEAPKKVTRGRRAPVAEVVEEAPKKTTGRRRRGAASEAAF